MGKRGGNLAMIIDELVALVSVNAGVIAQLSTNVYAGPVLPRGYGLPAALLHTVTTTTEYTMGGTTGMREARVQLDIYASTEDICLAGLKAVRALLKNYKGVLSGGSEVLATFWESDTDMPFSADTTKTGIGYRVMSNICFHYIEASS